MPNLYHYCSTETFVSIVSSRSVRLSSLTMSNDSKEGELIKEYLIQVAQGAGLAPNVLRNFERALEFTYEMFEGLGFCLSEEGDLLSQWRGYADDGRGIAIGFNAEYFEKLGDVRKNREDASFTLKQLLYDASKHAQLAAEGFEKLRPLLERGAFRTPVGSLLAPLSEEEKEEISKATTSAYFVVLGTMLQMFEIKHLAFAEELEWRLVSFSTKKPDNPQNKFHSRGDKIVPYLEVALEDLGVPIISAVVLGPRHTTPPHVVKQMLHSAGFGEPVITRSAATYR